jgi:hypothetical protein
MTRVSGTRLLVAGAVVAVCAAVIAGMVVVGSPGAQRQRKFDRARTDDLAAIERSVARFARLHKSLPRDLAALTQEPGYLVPRNDPESGTPYEYELTGADNYRLCATFDASSSRENENIYAPVDDMWVHGVGRQCFSRHADFQRYGGQ